MNIPLVSKRFSLPFLIGFTLILCLCALIGNWMKLPLFFGVEFIFGSIAAMFAIVMLGLIPGVIVAAVGGAYTLILWGHPWAMLIFTLEALFVSILYAKGLRNLIFCDLLYWLILGMALVLFFYHQIIGMQWDSAVLIAFKQALNGVFNALIAGSLFLVLKLQNSFRQKLNLSAIRLPELLFYVLLLMVLTAGSIPIIYDSYAMRSESEHYVKQHIRERMEHIANNLNNKKFSEDSINHFINHYPLNNDMGIGFIENNGKLIFKKGLIKTHNNDSGSLQNLQSGLMVWISNEGKSLMQRWKNGRYLMQTKIHFDSIEGTLLIEESTLPIIVRLEQQKLVLFYFLSLLLLFGLLFAYILSRLLSKPLQLLETASTGLTRQIAQGIKPILPNSVIEEYRSLSHSLDDMGIQLSHSFLQLKEHKKSLEIEVAQRTAEVNRLSQVARQTTNGVVITDEKGLIEWVNDGFTRISGYTLDEVLGKSPGKILQGEKSSQQTIARIHQAIVAGQSFNEDIINYHKSGKSYWVNINCNPLLDDKNKVYGFMAIESDISQQKMADESLLQSTLRFKSLFELSTVGICFNDFATKQFVDCNEAFLQQHDYSRKEILSLNFADISPDEYLEQDEQQWKILADKGRFGPYQKEFICKDGSRYPVLINGVIVADNQGKKIWTIIEDISERVQKELALNEMNQRLLLATDAARLGVWEYDLKTAALNWDSWMHRIYGISEDDFKGEYNDWKNAIHPDDAEIAEQAIQLALNEHTKFESEFRIVRQDKQIRHIKASGLLLDDANGDPIKMIGVNNDITEARVAELSLKEQADHTKAILDNILDGIITIDDKGIINSFNPAAENIFGYQDQEIIGQNIRILMPEPHHSEHNHYLQRYLTEGDSHIIGKSTQVEAIRRNGDLFPMDLMISEIRRQGKKMFIGKITDLSERNQVEKMKSEFVSIVSHELRTPLTSISGALSLLAGGALGELPQKIQDVVQIAQKNSTRLSRLINDLLDIDKLLAGKMTFMFELQPLFPLIEQSVKSMQTYSSEKNVTIILPENKADISINIDSHRFIQIMSNLLSNAIKFSPENEQVTISLDASKHQLTVSVKDNGPGIAEDDREKIFQKFSQADSSDTRNIGGTGLGLAISRELVEHMHGTIDFESSPGEGARFFFSFPRK